MYVADVSRDDAVKTNTLRQGGESSVRSHSLFFSSVCLPPVLRSSSRMSSPFVCSTSADHFDEEGGRRDGRASQSVIMFSCLSKLMGRFSMIHLIDLLATFIASPSSVPLYGTLPLSLSLSSSLSLSLSLSISLSLSLSLCLCLAAFVNLRTTSISISYRSSLTPHRHPPRKSAQ